MIKHKIKNLSLISIFALILLSNKILAQDFRLGFKGNPLFSTLKPSTDNNNSVGTKIGFSYGIMFDYFIKDNYAIATEFGISSMGGKVEFNRNDTTVNSNINLRYIEIPITLKLLTNEINDRMKIFGKFGLGLAFRMKSVADVEYKKGPNVYLNDDIKNASAYFQPFNASLVIGAGVEYNLAENLDLVAGLTYNNGLLNVMKSKSIYRLSNNSIKAFDANLNYVALNIGLLF